MTELEKEFEEIYITLRREIDDWQSKNGGKSINPVEIKSFSTLWKWIQQKIKVARIDENDYWFGKAVSKNKEFEGYCEGDFLNRIKELKGDRDETDKEKI